MKLRNNKTREIAIFGEGIVDLRRIGCKNVAEMLEAGWEDYEEPKDHWYINYQGEVYVLDPKAVPEYSRNAKSIGNYFETKEEAEKAVEKLKAWQRIKDKGVYFEIKVIDRNSYLAIKADPSERTFSDSCDIWEDIMYVFGGED